MEDTARARSSEDGATTSNARARVGSIERARARGRGRERDGDAADDGRRARARRMRSRSRDGARDDGAHGARGRSGMGDDGVVGTSGGENARARERERGTAAAAAAAAAREESSFELSGLLAAESNAVRGVALKYVEPVGEARAPTGTWRLYVFKGAEECGEPYKLRGSKTRYLIGRDRTVADIPSDHPSCSKQHCVIQFRDVDDGRGVTPYAFDLGSANGTFVNKKRIQGETYVRLKSRDVLKFGASTRDYVLLDEDEALGGSRS
ncbi:Forkhead-associated (FHA) domain [Ostreococcus tauri]|uniref:Forkhead-associated (FHA) domain n=1 Tax=Ostreococcus tauri TaxID=70448 RepID=A0A090M1I2_OSTTA|nr:Forkhead-associated (FHA) domain [Ostreococcus tauri]CEF98046.1 Forkhead-associated (FHA) domain [Ostreococcus tauri]|eukprot:XP_022839045.1 Forkhead-associated (FHA) domain [Ostreococcus tauri]